jgi:hypothetical protein
MMANARKSFWRELSVEAIGGTIAGVVLLFARPVYLALSGQATTVKAAVADAWGYATEPVAVPGLRLYFGALLVSGFFLAGWLRTRSAEAKYHRDIEEQVDRELGRLHREDEESLQSRRRIYNAVDEVESAVLRSFVDVGKGTLTVEELAEAIVLEDEGAKPWEAVLRLAERKYLYVLGDTPRNRRIVLFPSNFAELSEHPDWVGSDAMPKLVV